MPLSMPMKLLLSPFGVPALILIPIISIGLMVLMWKRLGKPRSDISPE
jgi:hypothetical protein